MLLTNMIVEILCSSDTCIYNKAKTIPTNKVTIDVHMLSPADMSGEAVGEVVSVVEVGMGEVLPADVVTEVGEAVVDEGREVLEELGEPVEVGNELFCICISSSHA